MVHLRSEDGGYRCFEEEVVHLGLLLITQQFFRHRPHTCDAVEDRDNVAVGHEQLCEEEHEAREEAGGCGNT